MVNDSNTSEIFSKTPINGPTNIVRLQSEKKVLYLMFDVHEDVQYQTKCSQNNAINIEQFLHLVFENIKEPLDFFIESSQENLLDKSFGESTLSENYITNTQKWVNRNFEKVNGKIKSSKNYPNIRFHYTDFRNVFEHLELNDIDILSFGEEFRSIIVNLKSLLNNTTVETNTSKENNRKKIISKILSKYKNKNIKEGILNYIQKVYEPTINTIIEFYDTKIIKIRKYVKKLSYPTNKFNSVGYGLEYSKEKKYNYKIDKFANQLVVYWLDLFINLTDLYFLRRFLDKDYIKRAVLYSGSFHCINIIQILCRHFKFEITHAYYCKIPIKQVNKIILENDNVYKITKFFSPTYIHQCATLENFPPWFT